MGHKCGYCSSILATQQTLERHQATAQKCLKIQSEIITYKCVCDEIFLNKSDHKEHMIKCPDFISEKLTTDINNLKEETKKQIEELKEKNKELELWKENTIKQMTLQLTSKTKSKTKNENMNNNNSINNSFNTINNILVFSPNLSREKIQEICDNKITPETLMKEHGLADVYVDNVARNKDSEYGIVNTNKREPVLNYKDEKGEIRRDIGAMELTRNFRECAEIPINKHLKTVKKKVKDLMDYSVIEENVKNKDKLVKDISKKLHIDNVKKELLILKEKKEGKYIEEKKEIKENKEIKQLEEQLEELKR
jgi:hypothetical protein